jgi:hypothetical protein
VEKRAAAEAADTEVSDVHSMRELSYVKDFAMRALWIVHLRFCVLYLLLLPWQEVAAAPVTCTPRVSVGWVVPPVPLVWRPSLRGALPTLEEPKDRWV